MGRPWVCMSCYQARKWCGKYHPHIEYSTTRQGTDKKEENK